MTEDQLQTIITKLKQQDELPHIEVKTGLDNIVKIGETISALSNSASWKDEEYGYFIWGIENDTWKIVGTKFDISKTKKPKKDKSESNQNGELWLNSAFNVIPHIEEKREFYIEGKRLYVLKIKNCGIVPICFAKIPYIRIGSHNQELLRYPEIHRQILNKNQNPDWSAQICEGATVEDLDIEAVEMAKNNFILKNPQWKREAQDWSVELFLKKAKMFKNNKVTNAEILLLGKRESVSLLKNCNGGAEISWKEIILKPTAEWFELPFVTAIPKVIDKITISNIELNREFFGSPELNIFKPNYTKENLRECVANAIAHQDYSVQGRIIILESIHKQIVIQNSGASLYSKEEFNKIRQGVMTPDKYRNLFLVNCMREIGLVESQGSGHLKMFSYNTTEVYLPLPEIDWSNQEKFILTIYGASLDQKFAEILQKRTDLEPEEILLLDQIQKGFKINKKLFDKLEGKGLITGTPTRGRLSLEIAKTIDKVNEEDTKTQVYDFRATFESLILTPLKTHKDGMNKEDMIKYLHTNLPYTTGFDQKKLRKDINNSLQKLQNQKTIFTKGMYLHTKYFLKPKKLN